MAQTSAMMEEAAGVVVADLIGRIVPGCDCGFCAELTEALVGALCALLLEPVVALMVLFLDGVSVISALLPAGDTNLVGMGLMKHWTGDVLEEALNPHLERLEHIFAPYAGAGLTHSTMQPVEHQAVAQPSLEVAAQIELGLLGEPELESIEILAPAPILEGPWESVPAPTPPPSNQQPYTGGVAPAPGL